MQTIVRPERKFGVLLYINIRLFRGRDERLSGEAVQAAGIVFEDYELGLGCFSSVYLKKRRQKCAVQLTFASFLCFQPVKKPKRHQPCLKRLAAIEGKIVAELQFGARKDFVGNGGADAVDLVKFIGRARVHFPKFHVSCDQIIEAEPQMPIVFQFLMPFEAEAGICDEALEVPGCASAID